MPLKKAIFVLFAEIAFGSLFLIIGYIIASKAGTGDNDASAAANFFGLTFIVHSLYYIIKRLATEYIYKKKKNWNERKKKMAVYLSIIAFCIILALPLIISMNKPGSGWDSILFIIDIVIFVISLYSFIKYLIKPFTDKRDKRRYEKIKKKYNLD